MHISINCSEILGPSPSSADYIALAREMEDLRFFTLWIGDHVAIPTDMDLSQYPYVELPLGYNWVDPFVFLAAISSVTSRLRLGTGMAVVPYRPPVQQAQSIATLDHMSDGRLFYGIGVGWMEAEFNMLDVPYAQRGRRSNEYVELMKALWSGSEEPFIGDFHSHKGAHLQPLPIQRPHPPIIVGGEGTIAFRRLIALAADGLQSVNTSPDDLRSGYQALEQMMTAANQDYSRILRSVMYTDPQYILSNTPVLEELDRVGVSEVVFAPICKSPAEGMALMRQLSGLIP